MPALHHTLNRFSRQYVLALHQYTRVRLGGALAPPPAAAGERDAPAVAALPGIGWLLGMAACLAFAIVSVALRGNAWGAGVAAVACTALTVSLTGALHETAFARVFAPPAPADASAARGTVAVVLIVAAKLSLLTALATASAAGLMAALFAGHVVSRYAPLLAADWLGSQQVDRAGLRRAALWCVVPLALMVPAGGVGCLVAALVAAAIGCVLLLRFNADALRAADDDAIGAVQQVCEVAFYFGAAIAVR